MLLMLLLGALVAGCLSAAVADDGVDTIRLPSNGLADESVTVAARESVDEKKRPWGKCCDHTFCNRRMPPGCRCLDPVDRCDDACIRCVVHPSEPSKRICMDSYIGLPGPNCTTVVNGNGVSNSDGDDDVDPDRCFPRCFKHGNDNDVPNGLEVAAREATAAVSATTETVSEKTGEEEARPWKCCDLARCTRSFPPTCRCMDKMKKCPKTCKLCEKDEASSLIVCLDSYRGKQAPACTPGAPPPPTFTPRGN